MHFYNRIFFFSTNFSAVTTKADGQGAKEKLFKKIISKDFVERGKKSNTLFRIVGVKF